MNTLERQVCVHTVIGNDNGGWGYAESSFYWMNGVQLLFEHAYRKCIYIKMHIFIIKATIFFLCALMLVVSVR